MSTTAAELVAEARTRVEGLDPEQVARELAAGVLVVDVREPDERQATGGLPGSVHVPRGLLEFKADPAAAAHLPQLDPERRTIVYCQSGARSALAAQALLSLGYRDVAHLDGGIQAWQAAGRPTA